MDPGGALHIFGYGDVPSGSIIDFIDFGVRNGMDFHNFGIRNGTDFQNICIKSKVRYTLRKVDVRSGVLFRNIGLGNGYSFEASMARPRPKCGQVNPPPPPGDGLSGSYI